VKCAKIVKVAVIDTSKKVYVPEVICGFTCHCEPGVFECTKNFKETLTEDLEAMSKLLPSSACYLLRRDTPLWINTSIIFGPVNKPVNGKICTCKWYMQ
jgi:hypothetical protein